MNYKQMWDDLQKHLLETIEQIDTYNIEGLFAVAGIGNAITQMLVLEEKYKEAGDDKK